MLPWQPGEWAVWAASAAVVVIAVSTGGCFSPTLPAIDCGPGNLCPETLVCQLPERICTEPTADAGPDGNPVTIDASPTDAPGLPALVDRGLLSRYFFDEAASGTAPTMALDAAANPLNLPIDYGGNLQYETVGDQRGLRWTTAGGAGTVGAEVNGSKIEDQLDESGASTFEIVVDLTGVENNLSRLLHLGPSGGNGDVAFGAGNPTQVELTWFNAIFSSRWPRGLVGTGRVVVHVIFDNAAAGADNRLQLYIDGALVTGREGNTPDNNDTINLDNNAEMSFGNRGGADRSIAGILYYAAIYNEPLSPTEVMTNTTRLLASDDR